ncbi:hypothetical protein SAMN04487950_0439 [Halogranum rubrum]|uniref:HEAT repeat-containing protein n=1 Tax=Halogranum rubrum TaxID=553466 RepID=A0A1I4BCT7_9EURY|nr:hypothetical protein [Halogranum rubrum]SFK65927.1 hypothetical protein SAMN04487950_0439 [Halogranum rubrum]
MDPTPETLLAAVDSGDSNQVNRAVDTVKGLDPRERATLLSACFESCRELYDVSDGYQRQSVVRFLDALNPRLHLGNAYGSVEQRTLDTPIGDATSDYRDALVGVYLRAIQDDDGRVRLAASRGLSHLATEYEICGEDAHVEALYSSLDELAADYSGTHRKHLVEARDQVGMHLDDAENDLQSIMQRFADEMHARDE